MTTVPVFRAIAHSGLKFNHPSVGSSQDVKKVPPATRREGAPATGIQLGASAPATANASAPPAATASTTALTEPQPNWTPPDGEAPAQTFRSVSDLCPAEPPVALSAAVLSLSSCMQILVPLTDLAPHPWAPLPLGPFPWAPLTSPGLLPLGLFPWAPSSPGPLLSHSPNLADCPD